MTSMVKIKSSFSDLESRPYNAISTVTYIPFNWGEVQWRSYNLAWIFNPSTGPGYTIGVPKVVPQGYNGVATGRDLLYLDYKRYVNEPGWRNLVKEPVAGYSKRKIDLKEYLALPSKPVFQEKIFRSRVPKLDLSFKPYEPKPPKTSSARVLKNWQINHLPKLLKHRAVFESRVILQRTKVYRRKLREYENRKQNFERKNLERRHRYDEALLKWQKRAKLVEDRRSKVKNWKNTSPFKKRITMSRPKLVDHPFLTLKLVPFKGEKLIFSAGSWDSTYGGDPDPNPSPRLINWWSNYTAGFLPISTKVERDQSLTGVAESTSVLIQNILKHEISSLDIKIIHKLYDKINDQKIHVGNFLAERAQTYELFFSSVSRLVKLIGAKKSLFRQVGNYFKSPKSIANDYLAWKFGVEPLVSDINGAIEVLMNSTDSPTITVRSKSSLPVSKTTDDGSATGLLTVSYVLRYELENSLAHSLQGLGLVNPAEIAWEVVPWSFVVDWFIPIGSYIQALNADTGLKFVSGTRSVKFVGNVDSNPTNSNSPTGINDSLSYNNSSYDAFKRSHPSGPYTITTAPLGKFSVNVTERTVLLEPPDRFSILLKNPLSVTHGLLSLSLLIQKIIKK